MSNSSHKKILIVDDEKDVIGIISDILEYAKYEIIAATNGEEAIELAKQKRPDLILLDIMMPDISGEDVAEMLSDDPSTADIPIIFLTGILTKEEEASIRKTGAQSIIAKPCTANELIDKIEKLISYSR